MDLSEQLAAVYSSRMPSRPTRWLDERLFLESIFRSRYSHPQSLPGPSQARPSRHRSMSFSSPVPGSSQSSRRQWHPASGRHLSSSSPFTVAVSHRTPLRRTAQNPGEAPQTPVSRMLQAVDWLHDLARVPQTVDRFTLPPSLRTLLIAVDGAAEESSSPSSVSSSSSSLSSSQDGDTQSLGPSTVQEIVEVIAADVIVNFQIPGPDPHGSREAARLRPGAGLAAREPRDKRSLLLHLYFRVLENLIRVETKRLGEDANLTGWLKNPDFHRCIIGECSTRCAFCFVHWMVFCFILVWVMCRRSGSAICVEMIIFAHKIQGVTWPDVCRSTGSSSWDVLRSVEAVGECHITAFRPVSPPPRHSSLRLPSVASA